MPTVNGVPDDPLDANAIYNLDHTANSRAIRDAKLGDLIKALCQKLDADAGVSATDFEATFCP